MIIHFLIHTVLYSQVKKEFFNVHQATRHQFLVLKILLSDELSIENTSCAANHWFLHELCIQVLDA